MGVKWAAELRIEFEMEDGAEHQAETRLRAAVGVLGKGDPRHVTPNSRARSFQLTQPEGDNSPWPPFTASSRASPAPRPSKSLRRPPRRRAQARTPEQKKIIGAHQLIAGFQQSMPRGV
jgi:hypothetical protein